MYFVHNKSDIRFSTKKISMIMLKQHDLHLTWTPLLYKPGTDCHKSSHIWSFFMIFWHHKCKHTPLTSSTNEGIHKKKKCFKNDYRLHLSLTANSGHLAWLQQLWMGAALSSLTSFCWSCCRLSSGTQHQDHCVTYCKQYSLHSGQWQHFCSFDLDLDMVHCLT